MKSAELLTIRSQSVGHYFTLWQQATIKIKHRDHCIIACSRHWYMGVILRAHPVCGASRIQRHDDWEAATVPWLFKNKFIWDHSSETTFISDFLIWNHFIWDLFIWDHIPLRPHSFETTFTWDFFRLRPPSFFSVVKWSCFDLLCIGFLWSTFHFFAEDLKFCKVTLRARKFVRERHCLRHVCDECKAVHGSRLFQRGVHLV